MCLAVGCTNRHAIQAYRVLSMQRKLKPPPPFDVQQGHREAGCTACTDSPMLQGPLLHPTLLHGKLEKVWRHAVQRSTEHKPVGLPILRSGRSCHEGGNGGQCGTAMDASPDCRLGRFLRFWRMYAYNCVACALKVYLQMLYHVDSAL
jgi:hypothetical protein